MPSLSFRRREWHSMPEMSSLPAQTAQQHYDQQQHKQKNKGFHLAICVGMVLVLSQVQASFHTTSASVRSTLVETTSPVIDTPTANSASSTLLSSSQSRLLVEQKDFIYQREDWDGSPVVIEEFKLLFFTTAKVGCTTWKQLFRRMMGFEDWAVEEWVKFLPWNPRTNGLKYLYDYTPEEASNMLRDPDYTKAIFVRDPKVRFVSAYLDKVMTHHSYVNNHCCNRRRTCQPKSKESITYFIELAQKCQDAHWNPQSGRMEDKYWQYINFVGHMENLSHDAEALLRKIGAWDRFGASGWGVNGTQQVFQASAGGIGRQHATRAQDKLKKYLTPEDEKLLDNWYRQDYAHPVMSIAPLHIFDDQNTTNSSAER